MEISLLIYREPILLPGEKKAFYVQKTVFVSSSEILGLRERSKTLLLEKYFS